MRLSALALVAVAAAVHVPFPFLGDQALFTYAAHGIRHGDRVEHRWVADLAPLFTVGAFYAAARAWDLTQIEYLVAFPLMLSLWAAADAGDAGRTRARCLLFSGSMASVVVYFKLVYVLVPLGFWAYLLIGERRRERGRDTTRDGLRDARPVYVWVDDSSLDIMRGRSPETLTLVDSLYCKVRRIADHAWYALRDSHECIGAR